MRIVCISASQVPSTTANSIQAMKACQALAQTGHQVHLLLPALPAQSGKQTASFPDLASAYGLNTPFPIEWLAAHPRMRRYDFSLSAIRRAKTLKADLVYVWPMQAAVLALLQGLPVVLEMHGPPEGRFGPLLFRLFLRLPGVKRILPITRALLTILERDYAFPGKISRQKDQFAVIAPNGIDLERYQDLPTPAQARLALGLPDIPTIAYSGSLYPGRGMALLIALARQFPRTNFLWIGGRPDDLQTWRTRLAEERLANVTLTGFIDNRQLPRYQAAGDILLMPYEHSIAGSSGGNSAEYCSPMKMFEYMACGRAIISSDLPVIREVLNEANAVLCPPEDEPAWCTALEDLLAAPERRQALSLRARGDVAAYTWQARARKALASLEIKTSSGVKIP